MARRFKHLTRADRLTLDKLYRKKYSIKEIADIIGVHKSTIYRELKRGKYVHRNSDLTEEERYSPDIAQEKYKENLKAKGPELKIGHDQKLADYIEARITDDGYSPPAVLGEIKVKGLQFDTTISKQTLYRYIDIGVFVSLSNKDLPVKGRRTKKKKKIHRNKQARAAAGTSIEKRPEEINTREEFGHWEMDTVIGARGESKNSLLVLTERKTRTEKIHKMKEHTAAAVVEYIDQLETEWGEDFTKVFKTITVDNGSEFADTTGLEKSSTQTGSRTQLFYCHPYSSYERGSNENQNKMIRRKIPKGTNFDSKTDEDIQAIEDWINDYPRELFGFESSKDQFNREIKLLCAY